MSVEHEHEQPPPADTEDTTPLAPGVWITEATGFACVPPRAQSDLCEVRKEDQEKKGGQNTAVDEPRIERYPER